MLLPAALAGAEGLGSAFTYQGKLTDSAGQPVANGSYSMTFKLFDDADPAPPENQIGSTVTKTVSVSGGLFTTDLDFGAAAFGAGEARWLQTTVGTETLPRVRINAAPCALFSSAPWATVSGGIAYSGGNVGIGTSSLAGVFQVGGSSDVTVDQAQLISNSGTCTLSSGGSLWQSFTAGVTSTLVAIETYPSGYASQCTFSVYAGQGTGGTLLSRQELQLVSGGPRLIVLKSPVAITAGSKYTFEVAGNGTVCMNLSSADVYPGGSFSNGGDAYFRTYVSSSPSVPLLFADASTQSLGIGTGTPGAKLDVNGGVNMTGFRLGTSTTAGYVLTADAYGNGTWQVVGDGVPTGPAGGDLTGTYPNPTIANNAVTDAKIAGVDWSKVANKPSSMPPSGTAGGDLSGSYPSPSIATGAVNSAKIADGSVASGDLASDSASLAKVSGGAMSVSSGNVSTTGRIDNAVFRSGAIGSGTSALAVDFAPANMDQGEVHFGNTGDNQWVDAWFIYSNGSVMGNYIKYDGSTTTTGHFRVNATGAVLYSKTNSSDSAGYLYYDAANKDMLVYEAAAGNNFCEWWSYDRRN
jgi:hypothetical protein